MKPLSEDWKDVGHNITRFANPAIDVLSDLYKTKYNASDLRPVHEAISALIEKDGKILMLDHVKLNFWTIPIGKIELGDTIEQTLKIELKEEVNIIPVKYVKLGQFTKSYMREKTKVQITSHIFRVNTWRGTVKNNEPKKHRSIKWMSEDELMKWVKAKKVSDSTLNAIKYMK